MEPRSNMPLYVRLELLESEVAQCRRALCIQDSDPSPCSLCGGTGTVRQGDCFSPKVPCPECRKRDASCPGCGGEPDNGFSRDDPPVAYYCTKCEAKRNNGPRPAEVTRSEWLEATLKPGVAGLPNKASCDEDIRTSSQETLEQEAYADVNEHLRERLAEAQDAIQELRHEVARLKEMLARRKDREAAWKDATRQLNDVRAQRDRLLAEIDRQEVIIKHLCHGEGRNIENAEVCEWTDSGTHLIASCCGKPSPYPPVAWIFPSTCQYCGNITKLKPRNDKEADTNVHPA